MRRPNIVVVLVDDVGYADFSYNGAIFNTENIDKLSSKGLRFDRFYASPTCSPSRASLLTGRYPVNTGITFALMPGSPAGLPEHISTLPQSLREIGYSCSMV